MSKRIIFAGLGIALLASPLLASADTASDLQTKISALLAQIKELRAQLVQMQGTNPTVSDGGGVGVVVPPSLYPVDPVFVCPAFKRVLAYGANGDDVVQLQKFLVSQGLLSSDSATGFFGPMTQAAIQKLQATNGIVSSGDPSTTGWGIIGPTTRAWIARWCNRGGGNGNLSASPTSGKAPLAVAFSVSGKLSSDVEKSYTIDFGDGASGPVAIVGQRQCFAAPCESNIYGANHTYTATGTYTAKLLYQPPFVCNAPPGAACNQVMPAPQIVGTVTIRVGSEAPSCPIYSPPLCSANEQLVGGGVRSDGCQNAPRCVPKTTTTPGAPSINGIGGPASLAVGQQGTWTVHASVASNANTNLRYSVIWGDEAVLDRISALAGTAPTSLQTSGSFTHAYASIGTYNPVFTVANDAGSAQTSASVRVGGSGTICEHASPPSGCYWRSGTTCTQDTLVCSGGNSALSAAPTSGAAPLAVQFFATGNFAEYSIDFGDGQTASGGIQDTNCAVAGRCAASHTYTANGTYTAKLTVSSAGACDSGYCAKSQVVGTVTITVGGGGTSSGTFTATPKTGATPLMVTFTGVGNNISFGDEGPTFIASGNGSLGTMTHVYRNSGEYTATSDGRSLNVSVIPDKLASFGGAGASPNLCVYNNRTYASGTSADVPVLSCGTFADYRKCGGAIAQGATGPIITERYACRSGQWFDSNNIPLESELVNATSCLASDGVTAVANGQFIAYGLGAIGFADLNAFGKRIPTMKCDNGKWLSCDAYGNNCTQASAGTNTNLANALSAAESALKAFIASLGQ